MINKKFANVFLFLFIFVFIISFASAGWFSNFWGKISGQVTSADIPQASSDSCTDNDTGINYFEKGTLSYYENATWNSFTDYCESNVSLHEGFCDNNNRAIVVVQQSGSSYYCIEGIFVPVGDSKSDSSLVASGEKESDSSNPSSGTVSLTGTYIGCYETDAYANGGNGNAPYIYGRTTYWENPQYKKLAKDYCTGSEEAQPAESGTILNEYYCYELNDGTFELKQETYSCNCQDFGVQGAKCLDGSGNVQAQAQNQNTDTSTLTFRERFRNFFTKTNVNDNSGATESGETDAAGSSGAIIGLYNECKETDSFANKGNGDAYLLSGRTTFRDGVYQGSPWTLKKDFCSDGSESNSPIESGDYIVEYYCVKKQAIAINDPNNNYDGLEIPTIVGDFYYEVWEKVYDCVSESKICKSYGNYGAKCIVNQVPGSNQQGEEIDSSSSNGFTFGQKIKNIFTK
ncbi:MAG: hypothetical protein WC812_03660 [Candidatus Pacearchaeota archaeon]|jgi:hypothetical protein